jgi:S1-C subfamily serine protease
VKGFAARWCRTVLACALAAACASGEPPPPAPEPQAAARDSVVPGTIGVLVAPASDGVVVAAVAAEGPAGQAGMRVGDVVRSYNGVAVLDTRQFYRLVLESPPGSRAQVEFLRDGSVQRIEVPVKETDTAPRD